jgi:hypothetical protein
MRKFRVLPTRSFTPLRPDYAHREREAAGGMSGWFCDPSAALIVASHTTPDGAVENLHPGWWNSFSLKDQEYRRHRRGCGEWG